MRLFPLQLKVEKRQKKPSQVETIYFFIKRTPFQRLSFVCSGRDEICTEHKRNKNISARYCAGITQIPCQGSVLHRQQELLPGFSVFSHCCDSQCNEYNTENISKLLIKILYFSTFEEVLGEFDKRRK